MCRIEDEVMKVGRPQGGKNRKWAAQEKISIVERYLASGVGRHRFAAGIGVASGQLYQWIKRYQEKGALGLESKKRTGNPYAALHSSKNMSKLERLELTVAMQKVEIARLKNGYRVRGGGANKEFVTLSDVSIKSSKN